MHFKINSQERVISAAIIHQVTQVPTQRSKQQWHRTSFKVYSVNTETLIGFHNVWWCHTAFKQRTELTPAITLSARFITREATEKLLLLSAATGLTALPLKLQHGVTACCPQNTSRTVIPASRLLLLQRPPGLSPQWFSLKREKKKWC